MSPPGSRQRITTHKVYPERVSPDDVLARLNEAAARQAADTRTEA